MSPLFRHLKSHAFFRHIWIEGKSKCVFFFLWVGLDSIYWAYVQENADIMFTIKKKRVMWVNETPFGKYASQRRQRQPTMCVCIHSCLWRMSNLFLSWNPFKVMRLLKTRILRMPIFDQQFDEWWDVVWIQIRAGGSVLLLNCCFTKELNGWNNRIRFWSWIFKWIQLNG